MLGNVLVHKPYLYIYINIIIKNRREEKKISRVGDVEVVKVCLKLVPRYNVGFIHGVPRLHAIISSFL